MNVSQTLSLRSLLLGLCTLAFSLPSAVAGTVNISSPQVNATVAGTVSITASANEAVPYHVELWDNGGKLGDFFSSSVNASFALTRGAHTLTALSVNSSGIVLDSKTVNYTVVNAAPANGVTVTSPASGSTSISAVSIAASASEASVHHLSIWDNGSKLGDVPGSSVSGVYVLPSGSHVLTVQAVTSSGLVISSANVDYTIAENCSNSEFSQCDLDQLPADNVQGNCNPAIEERWVANSCGAGVQGADPSLPLSTTVEQVYEGGAVQNQGNRTLSGHAMHLAETQGTHASNVLFRGVSPSKTPGSSIHSHWTLDEYVYLADPTAHQALEMDAQYTAAGIWTKFYTECAFNMNNGMGYWAVFDSSTGGWIFLNGTVQGGQSTPVVPCNRSQFSQPWSGSSNPSFTGWHHISWTFQRESDGTVTFQSVTFDSTTTAVNFHPNSQSGGSASDNGNFSALVQLDGVANTNLQHSVVDAYVSEVSLTHTP